MSHSTVSGIKNLVTSARVRRCRETSIKLTQSVRGKLPKEKRSMSINSKKKTAQKQHSVIENITSEQAGVLVAFLVRGISLYQY